MRVIILLTLLGAAMALPKKGNRIVGGTPASIEGYPYMANMQYTFRGTFPTHACGGTVLNSRSILSAAHCFYGDVPSEWLVRLGSRLASSGGTMHGVSQLFLYPEYDHNALNNDVAVVRLSDPAIFSETVQRARIAGPNYNLADETVVYAAGWGALRYQTITSEQLMHTDMNIINQELCVERYAYLKSLPGYEYLPDVTDTMMCTGILDVGGKSTCHGDSGGPIVHDGDVVVGITSWAYHCGNPIYPAVNVRVSKFTDWIADNA